MPIRVLARATACLLAATVAASAQSTPAPARAALPADTGRLSIERVFRGSDFDDADVPAMSWLADGRSWLEIRAAGDGQEIVRVDASTGRATVIVPRASLVREGSALRVSAVTPSPDGRTLLIATGSRAYVPHKTGATWFVWDVGSARLSPVSGNAGLQLAAKLSPDGRRVAFVRDNDLWVAEVGGAERRLTSDGSATILNGISDWVYDEELDLEDAWRWSPDGRRIAFLRFDQSRIPVYPMVDYTQLYPPVFPLRHPKAGQPNSRVTAHVADAATGATVALPAGEYEYLARLEWLGADSVTLSTMPRHQDRQEIRVVPASGAGAGRRLLLEQDSLFVDLQEPVWIDGGRRFLWISDRSGWRQLYLYERDGRLVRRVTADGVDVTGYLGADERRGEAYVQVAEPDPTQRRVWRFRLADGRGERLTTGIGSSTWTVGPDARYAVSAHSRLGTPPVTALVELPARRVVRTIADNAALVRTIDEARVTQPQFFRLPVPDGTRLDAYRIVPPGFDSTRAYPVLVYVYGGPASPTVSDSWGDKRYFFHQMLAQRGYVVVSVDGRSSAWRGRAWRKAAHLQLGIPETRDQLDAIRWLGRQRWVDRSRIGMWGRSYGGFMTALVAGRAGDLLKVGLAVVPVTDWRYYDTIYTERYMRTPEENPEGYRATAPLTWADSVTARLLIVTSTGDDNVHAQNALVYADRLTAAHKPYEMELYLNRPHPLSGGNTRAHWYAAMYRFVLEQL